MNVNNVATPNLSSLMERKMRLQHRLAIGTFRGKPLTAKQIEDKETELAVVNEQIAADDEQFAQRHERGWQDTDPARQDK